MSFCRQMYSWQAAAQRHCRRRCGCCRSSRRRLHARWPRARGGGTGSWGRHVSGGGRWHTDNALGTATAGRLSLISLTLATFIATSRALDSRSPNNPALQMLQQSSELASTTPQRPIWNSRRCPAGQILLVGTTHPATIPTRRACNSRRAPRQVPTPASGALARPPRGMRQRSARSARTLPARGVRMGCVASMCHYVRCE